MTDHTHSPDLRERLSAEKGRAFWRSLEEYSGTPEFAEMLGREFPQHASEWDEGVSRRRFLELSAASLSLAGLSACVKQPREGIVPYVKQPEEVVPGRPLFFATAASLGGYATGLLVESHTGRPTKVEGNPDHPASLGATDAYAQALVLSLYDPDRSQTITRLGQIRTWTNFTDELAQRVKIHSALSGEGFRILTQTVTSPTLASQIRAVLAAMPKARWHQWEPAGRDAARAGARLAFGQAVETRHDFSKADVVLTLDADPFVSGPGALAAARGNPLAVGSRRVPLVRPERHRDLQAAARSGPQRRPRRGRLARPPPARCVPERVHSAGMGARGGPQHAAWNLRGSCQGRRGMGGCRAAMPGLIRHFVVARQVRATVDDRVGFASAVFAIACRRSTALAGAERLPSAASTRAGLRPAARCGISGLPVHIRPRRRRSRNTAGFW